MRLNVEPFDKRVIKMMLTIFAMMFVMKLTKGTFGAALLVAGVVFAISNKTSYSLAVYILYPFFAILNGILCPHMPMFSAVTRIGTSIMTLALMLSAGRRSGRENIPLIGIFAYLLVVTISSMGGYFPPISYMKMANFVIFIIGLCFGIRNIHNRPSDLAFLRAFGIAVCGVLVFGSIMTLPFPAIAYSTSVGVHYAREGAAFAEELARNMAAEGGMLLFAGITNQSQSLAPLLCCASGLVMCDMVLVEKRVHWLHAAILLGTLPLLFMTRSRVAFFAFVTMLVMVYFYAMPKIRVDRQLKVRLRSGMMAGLGLVLVFAVLAEVRGNSITRWLRKSNDTMEDRRGITEALTASRMGKIEMLMHDFKQNPLLGKGFQVTEDTPLLFQLGVVNYFSAPVEKGVLPVLVLGEAGVLGAFAFAGFLLTFYATCRRKRYIATATLFTVLLATNMGEATFFSPSGTGGILWILSVVGGFVIDMYAKYYNDNCMNVLAVGRPLRY